MPSPIPPTPSRITLEYLSSEYGFSFKLPDTWEGFSTINTTWEGITNHETKGSVVVEEGPMITIQHPNSTPEKPRQGIPIMVFTLQQWESTHEGEWHIGAAPVGPIELARSDHYVFALPARYNYAFLEGWEEVEEIIRNNPIEIIDSIVP